tara:strand:+ start:5606 stop:5827 length:222 start_codon:yes stop_codon:yes gene_type:complete
MVLMAQFDELEAVKTRIPHAVYKREMGKLVVKVKAFHTQVRKAETKFNLTRKVRELTKKLFERAHRLATKFIK